MKQYIKKGIVKILSVCVLLVLSIGLFCACNDNNEDNNNGIRFENINKYGAVIFNNINNFMRSDFLDSNRTLGVYYIVDVYDEEIDSWVNDYRIEENAPKVRDFVLDSEESFQSIFNDFPTQINFETEILVLHMFTYINTRPAILTDVTCENGNLKVDFKLKMRPSNIGDTTAPGQRCIVVKLNKIDITSVEFAKQ